MNCKLCNTKLKKIISFGKMPLVNSFLKINVQKYQDKFDLSVGFCPKCFLVQIINIIPPSKLFRHYFYFSHNSKDFINHSRKNADYLEKRLALKKKNLVMEIASNDGTQLQFFKQKGISIIGIDPAKNITKLANSKGIPTITEFFNHRFAINYLKDKNKKPNLIFGANILAHVPKIYDFMLGLKTILSKNGTAVFEFPYIEGLFENKFDTIYHEHVFYYSLLALENVFLSVNLELYDAEKITMQGGSLRIFVSHKNNFPVSKNIKKIMQIEKNKEYDKFTTYLKIQTNIKKLKKDLADILIKIKKSKKSIAGYGVAAKGVLLMNYFNIGKNYLLFVADRSREKQGHYIPGTLMKIESPNMVFEKKPDYLFIFAWNLKDEIMEQFKDYHDQGGRFIIPIPSVKII